jgi:hypothetical protein
MVRSAAAVLAVLILPTFALGQVPQGTHTVVNHDTLWDLAQRYYSNPYQWRTIWDANRGVVEDPNWIYPAEVLVIPGLPGGNAPPEQTPMAEPMEPAEQAAAVPVDLIPFGLRQARPTTEGARTVFYDPSGAETATETVASARARAYVPVSPDVAYSAPWLIGFEGEPSNQGYVMASAEPAARAASMRAFESIRISMPSPARVGANLQLFRVDRSIESIGRVVLPTGVARVETIGNGEVIARVIKQYDRIQAGDLVGPLPTYTPTAGVYAQPVSGGSEAMIMGFAGTQVITDIGHIAFLDLGRDDGIGIGDEFVLYGEANPSAPRGSLQVVGVTATMASARVMSLTDNVFQRGVVVRLSKKMR